MTHVILLLGGSAAVSIVVKATVIAALGLIGAWLARGSRAAVRHAVLAACFAALLALPAASLLIPPVHVTVAQQTVSSSFPAASDTTEFTVPTNTRAGIAPSVSRWSVPPIGDLLFAGWIVGIVFFLLRIIVGLRQVHFLRRFGLPWREGQIVVERMTVEAGVHRYVEVLLHESLTVPVTCGVVRPAIVLPPDARNWDVEDLGRAIVHELEHVRRWDWASQCLARAVCAAYWFHPLVWIAWRRLSLEAERACDDAVLRRSEATAYADQLVELAQRLSTERKSPALAMANRSDLSSRVRAVLDGRQQRGRAGTCLVIVACAVAAIMVLAVSPLRMVAAPQLTPDQSSGSLPAFDVASIKIALPAEPGLVETHFTSDTLTLNRVILAIPLMVAYNVESFQISGPDNLLRETRYDIVAKASGPVPESQLRLMLRRLLAERFHATSHWEKREMSVLALLVAKGGPKFHVTIAGTEVSGRTLNGFSDVGYQYSQGQDGRAHRVLTNASMAAIAQLLGGNCVGGDGHTPALDMTGNPGRFDLAFTDPPRTAFDDPPTGDYKLAACKTMMQDELGLTFERRKAPVDVLVIDRADPIPTPN